MRQIISIVIILVLVALLVSCRTDVKTLSWIDGGLFDGEYIYRYFPEGWYYYGKFNNPFGRTDGGDSFYSNDSGVFIKEKNRLFSSMAKAPLAKDTFSFPDIYGEESLVVFS
ncbi:MAG: hypothetical protein IKG85_01475, partial [Clostridia bacterium]|nr:hypothetical protein [Clostridia bacterium]